MIEIEMHREWNILETHLRENNVIPEFKNQFFRRLTIILNDDTAGIKDILTAYRDALRASPKEHPNLTFKMRERYSDVVVSEKYFLQSGLVYDELLKKLRLKNSATSLGLDQIHKVYQLEERRKIPRISFDICLSNRLSPKRDSNEDKQCYRGHGQQIAIRTALQSQPGSTIVINLPTGVGKTLVAHSLCLFSDIDRLTLVITPTTALAIEQAERAKDILEAAGEPANSNLFFGGSQTPQQRKDIKDRIRAGQQRILFTSPESARGALLPCLFDAARDQKLANIILDEAHLIDQWGAEFRPDFQIFAAVTHALIKASQRTIRCCLLSATFTDASLSTLRKLFTFDDHDFIEVHNSFLRPEPQYNVVQHRLVADFDGLLEKSLMELPRPLILYTLTRKKAEQVVSKIRSSGYNRVGLFTGDTNTNRRSSLIKEWNTDQLDIMVATSAFGVGMDKDDVRSILHVQPPENIDRFYQEVGRSGRDGRASQSLVIFHHSDLSIAEKINKDKLITEEMGLTRWNSLFNHRLDGDDSNVVNITNMHGGISRKSSENESWNWRTLLLMQRSGLIEIEFEKPEHAPQWRESQNADEYSVQERKFYDAYYQTIKISTLLDNHRDKTCWSEHVGPQRTKETQRKSLGFERLKHWLLNPSGVSLCKTLSEQYTINGASPQTTCGGCPHCRQQGKYDGNFPTLNFSTIIKRPHRNRKAPKYIYYQTDHSTPLRRLINEWVNWIQSLIEKEEVLSIYSSEVLLGRLSKSLPKGIRRFWSDNVIPSSGTITLAESSLVIIPPGIGRLPLIDSDEEFYILLAPHDLPSHHFGRLWWNDYYGSQPLDHFLQSSS